MFARENWIKASIRDYDFMFRKLLELGQNLLLELFTTVVSIEDFSLRRSPRCGATTEEENNNMDTVAIELIKQWREKEAARDTESGLSMRQVNMQVSRAVVASLSFSYIY